ncbi:MAG: PEP-CTERM sorting domain-containing protein [Opitutaceae bacterium]|jgi:hypothetical protein|nr:PEP-CTERM sorting domain-containing protein [Opitutaceae bacterium]
MKTNARFASSSSVATVRCALVALIPLLAGVGSAFAQKLETIALYDFSDPANLFKDTSGKNNNLSNPASGVTRSTEHSSAASTDYSACFDGTLPTAANRQINFSPYTALTFDWHMKADPADFLGDITTRMLIQTAWQEDVSGAVSVYIQNASESIILRVVHRMSSGWAWASFLLPDLSSWNNYTLTIDNSKTGNDHISLLINGDSRTAVPGSTSYTATVAGSFVSASQYTFLGNNNAKNRPFKGYLQNFEIYSGTPTPAPVPEPAMTAVLAGLATGLLVLFIHRRR